jgi:hypothetical protein
MQFTSYNDFGMIQKVDKTNIVDEPGHINICIVRNNHVFNVVGQPVQIIFRLRFWNLISPS